jgi:hypothetical protein
VLVVASASAEFAELLRGLPPGKCVIDLVGVWNAAEDKGTSPMESYDGIAW